MYEKSLVISPDDNWEEEELRGGKQHMWKNSFQAQLIHGKGPKMIPQNTLQL